MKKMIFITALSLSLSMMQEARSGKNMKVMMKWQLTEYLDLEESQAEKFFPKMNSACRYLYGCYLTISR